MTPDPFALPCHPEFRLDAGDRDWRSVGIKSDDQVLRKSSRCPECKTQYTAYQRRFDADALTVEWLRPTPFRVTALAVVSDLPQVPLWQDDTEVPGLPSPLPHGEERISALEQLQSQTAGFPDWSRSLQLCTAVQTLTARGAVFAEPGDLLLERRERWNPQDRRLALLWSPRLGRQVVAWHSFARLPQVEPQV